MYGVSHPRLVHSVRQPQCRIRGGFYLFFWLYNTVCMQVLDTVACGGCTVEWWYGCRFSWFYFFFFNVFLLVKLHTTRYFYSDRMGAFRGKASLALLT